MATFILIPGGWQGGWVYQPVADILGEHGHRALPMTLSGLGDTRAPTANLETHIGEVVDVVTSLDHEVILVGHSYAGMVVSGVADALPSQIRALVYVDAYVPNSGDSMWSLTTQRFRDLIAAGAEADGLNSAPPPKSDPRFRPHPIGAFLQSITLSGRWREVLRKTYVGAHGWEGSPFVELYKRLSHDSEWSTIAFNCGHNIARVQPKALAEVLLAQAQV